MAYVHAYSPSAVSIGGSPQLMAAGTSCTSSTTCLIKRKSGRPKAPNPLDDPNIPLKRARRIMANRASADRSKQRAKIVKAQARQKPAALKSQMTDVQQQLQATQDCMDVVELVQCAVTGIPAPAATANSLKQQLRHGGTLPAKPGRKRPRSSTQQVPYVMVQPQSQRLQVEHLPQTQAFLQPEVPSSVHVHHPCQHVAQDSAAQPHALHAGAAAPAAGSVPLTCLDLDMRETMPNKQPSPREVSTPAVLPLPQTSAAANTAGNAHGALQPATSPRKLQQVLPPLISLLQALQQYAEHAGVTAT